MNIITKAVFPVAGLGSRFLPATKASPKEMLPVVNKPLIQYAVEEAVLAGITQLIFVTSASKRSIEDHLDSNYELESRLERDKKYDLLETVRNIIPAGVNCVYIRQSHPKGLGDAIYCARELIGNEAFAVLLADDLVYGHEPCLAQLIKAYKLYDGNILAVEEVIKKDFDKYGIIGGKMIADNLCKLNKIVEKPSVALAPSNLGVIGRYILKPDIFHYIHEQVPGVGQEVQLTDAIAQMLVNQNTYGLQVMGERFDCGSVIGYLKAVVHYGVRHENCGTEFKEHLNSIFNKDRTTIC